MDTHLFSAWLPVLAGKTLVSVTLPDGATQGQLHIFSIGTSTTAHPGPVITSVQPTTANAGDQVTIKGSGFDESAVRRLRPLHGRRYVVGCAG